MRYSTFIIVFMLLASSASGFVPVRTLEPVPVTVIAPVEPVVVPEDEPPVVEETVVISKLDVTESEVLSIDKEGADPDDGWGDEGVDPLDTFQAETDLEVEGVLDSSTMDPLDSLDDEDTYKPDRTVKSHGNPEPWTDDDPDSMGFVEGTVEIIGHPGIDVGKKSPDMPVDPVDMPPDPLDRRAMPVDPVDIPPDPWGKRAMPPDPLDKQPGVFARAWTGIVRLFTWQSPESKEQFQEAMEGSDVAMYEGHGRYGSGPRGMDGKGGRFLDGKGDMESRDSLMLEGDLGGKYYDGRVDVDASIGLEEDSLDGKGDDIRDSVDDLHEGHQTFWARVKSWFSLEGRGYNELPEVDDEVEDTTPVGEMYNMDPEALKNATDSENRQFTMVSNIMKNKHDTAKSSVDNVR